MKPKKTAEELVQMLHDEKGIQFHLISEEQAVECFSQRNNYLRTASYRKNYPKHIAGPNAGKYIHLEFAYLAELSTLDFYLRELLLQMCILKRVIFCASAVTDVARIFFCLRRCVEFRYRPATHPIHFAAVSPDKIHRCAAWAVFFFFTNKILCSCSIFQNLFLVVDCTTAKCYSCA